MVVEPVERFFADSYFPLVLSGAQAQLAEREVQLVLDKNVNQYRLELDTNDENHEKED